MGLIINIYYTGKEGSAKRSVNEIISSGLVDKIRAEDGNMRYEYFFPLEDEETVLLIDKWENQRSLDMHHKSEMMKEISII